MTSEHIYDPFALFVGQIEVEMERREGPGSLSSSHLLLKSS